MTLRMILRRGANFSENKIGGRIPMRIRVHLYPPLNNAAGRSRLEVALDRDDDSLQALIDKMVGQFGDRFRRLLYDDRGRIVGGWCAFINQKSPVHFNQPEALATSLRDGDEISFLLALAGG
jgi:molybdopterin converting factor small subunit